MKTLGLFFTQGKSLNMWHEEGLLDREKMIYEELLKNKVFDQIFWFTYGTQDCKYEKFLKRNIYIIPKPRLFSGRIGSILYSILIPIIRMNYVKKCSVLKTNQMNGSWSAVLCKIVYRKPLVVRTGFIPSKNAKMANKTLSALYFQLIEKFSYINADAIIVTSQQDKRYLEENYKLKNIAVIHNFIHIRLFKPINIPKTKDIVFVGRLNEEKNIFNLINSIQGTTFSLDIYGSGILEKQLFRLTLDNKLSHRVSFEGNIPNSLLPKVLNEHKMFVLPSFYEGMPKALLEAMACGLACLGTNVMGINEIIKHGENGWLVKTDKESIRAGIVFLMKNNRLREELGKKARKTIEEKFDLVKSCDKETKIYKMIEKRSIQNLLKP